MYLTKLDCLYILDNITAIPEHKQPVVAWKGEGVESSVDQAKARIESDDIPQELSIGAVLKDHSQWEYVSISRSDEGYSIEAEPHSGIQDATVEELCQILPAVKAMFEQYGC
ncbi:hypothetical protein MKR81_27210 (plasmid) [Vibrio campbellii]|uniref:hypothetical protein n=1 Tax=Vibrio campbellii TaxID=680 RepID=UPI001F085672|nr:hypothetical protein [Vibrio campbellii]UMM06639.1 hypothetical protein MKR81_27210 [Vibrio campbellii]